MKLQMALFSTFCFLSLALTGCDKLNFSSPRGKNQQAQNNNAQALVKGTVIAKVNNTPITLETLSEEVDSFNAAVPEDRADLKITTRDKKIDYLKNQLVRRILLYQQALLEGIDRKADVQQILEKTKQDVMVVEFVRQEAEKIEVSYEEIKDYYDKYKDQLKEPQERLIREIMVPTESEAKEILIQLLQGTEFSTLAKERSKAPSSKNGGDLGFIKPGGKFAEFDKVAFADTLEVNKFSNIFSGPGGYYILKLEAVRGGKEKSFSELKDDIKRGLTFVKQQQKIDDLVSKLSREAKIEYYEGEIK